MAKRILRKTLEMKYLLLLFALWVFFLPILEVVCQVERSLNPVWIKTARIYLWEERGHTVRSIQRLDRWEQERLLYQLQRDVPYFEDREAQPISFFYNNYKNRLGIPFTLGLLFLLIAKEVLVFEKAQQ